MVGALFKNCCLRYSVISLVIRTVRSDYDYEPEYEILVPDLAQCQLVLVIVVQI